MTWRTLAVPALRAASMLQRTAVLSAHACLRSHVVHVPCGSCASNRTARTSTGALYARPPVAMRGCSRGLRPLRTRHTNNCSPCTAPAIVLAVIELVFAATVSLKESSRLVNASGDVTEIFSVDSGESNWCARAASWVCSSANIPLHAARAALRKNDVFWCGGSWMANV